jgi:hypothetical protein
MLRSALARIACSPYSLARGPRPNPKPNPNPGSCVVGGVAKSPQVIVPLAFIDLPGFTHVRFGTHDRSDHFALEVDDEHGHAFIANFPALVSMILGTSWVILVEMLCP